MKLEVYSLGFLTSELSYGISSNLWDRNVRIVYTFEYQWSPSGDYDLEEDLKKRKEESSSEGSGSEPEEEYDSDVGGGSSEEGSADHKRKKSPPPKKKVIMSRTPSF